MFHKTVLEERHSNPENRYNYCIQDLSYSITFLKILVYNYFISLWS